MQKTQIIIIDLFVIISLTLIGFISHGTLGQGLWHVLSTLVPIVLGWWLSSWLTQLYQIEKGNLWDMVIKPLLVVVLAYPLALWVRALISKSVVIPVFVLVMIGVTWGGLLIWRLGLWLWWRKSGDVHG